MARLQAQDSDIQSHEITIHMQCQTDRFGLMPKEEGGGGVREGERGGKKGRRVTERERDRQRQRQTETEREREREREGEREIIQVAFWRQNDHAWV